MLCYQGRRKFGVKNVKNCLMWIHMFDFHVDFHFFFQFCCTHFHDTKNESSLKYPINLLECTAFAIIAAKVHLVSESCIQTCGAFAVCWSVVRYLFPVWILWLKSILCLPIQYPVSSAIFLKKKYYIYLQCDFVYLVITSLLTTVCSSFELYNCQLLSNLYWNSFGIILLLDWFRF